MGGLGDGCVCLDLAQVHYMEADHELRKMRMPMTVPSRSERAVTLVPAASADAVRPLIGAWRKIPMAGPCVVGDTEAVTANDHHRTVPLYEAVLGFRFVWKLGAFDDYEPRVDRCATPSRPAPPSGAP